MPTSTDPAERPTFVQIRRCLPPEARHTVLRLMPFGSRAPTRYRQLQEGIYATLAPDRTPLDRARALLALWSLYDQSMPSVPDAEALLIEVAQHVCDTNFTYQAAEVLAVADLNHRGIFVDEGLADGLAVSLPVLTRGERGTLDPNAHAIADLTSLSRAMLELAGRGVDELSAMPEPERLSAIRLLRLFLIYGRIGKSSDTAAARKLFFDQFGLILWQALMSPGFEPGVNTSLYGQAAINRVHHALQAAATAEQMRAASADEDSPPAESRKERATHLAEQPSGPTGPMHLVVRHPFPRPRDRDDQEAMKPYERLRQPMPLALLPTVERLDQCREALLVEFPWAHNVIDALFHELRAKKLLGGLALGFTPILLAGPTGCGKTRLARRLGEVLDLSVHTLNLGGASDALGILATNRGWGNAQPSPLLSALLDGQATKLVVLDEIDKPGNLARNGSSVESALLPLLDPEEAGRWRDGCLQVECDLRCLQFVFTCNSTTWLSAALRSRVRTYEIRRPTTAELRGVVDFVVRDLEVEWGLPSGAFLGVPITRALPARIGSLRALRKAVSRAVAAWVSVQARGPKH